MAGYDSEKIKSHLVGKAREIELICLDCVDSTNSFSKELFEKGERRIAAVIANAQTAGRGTRGRSFVSECGAGLYMSILFYPDEKVTPADITVFAAVAVCRSLESLVGVSPSIKWVNDIYLGGKKLSGILTEGRFGASGLDYAVMGVGINTHGCTLPVEISDIATSIEKECGKKIDRELLAAEIINRFVCGSEKIGSREVMAEYKRRSFIVGKEVKITKGNEEFLARVLEILDTGALLIEKNTGESEKIQSADVTLKLK